MSHESDHTEERLAALGRQSIDPEVRAAHLRRADAAVPVTAPRRFGPAAIAAAAVLGFFVGSAGLASAGALPDPAQNVAHDVLGVVKVEVPEGGNRSACVSQAAKIEDKDAKQAAKDACPKGDDVDDDDPDTDDEPGGDDTDDAPGKSGEAPGKSGEAPGKSGEAPGRSGEAPGQSGEAPGKSGDAPGQTKHADDPCKGKPPWAGKMSKDERDALKEQFDRSACADDADTELDDTELDDDELDDDD